MAVLKVKKDGKWQAVPIGGYNLPIATSDTLGGIKVGAGLSINSETGVLSASGGGTADSVDWANITSKPDFKTVATSGSYNDLTDKPTIPTKVSELENDSNYITSVPEEYVTETELAGKNYATVSQIPSLDGYATEAWVGEQGYLTEHQDISNLATKEELASKADSANVYSKSETYTKVETDSAIKQASATVFKYKGAVDNYEGLPTEEVSVGDVYSLRDTNGEYVATKASPEPTWEYLGVEVDLSQYSTTAENDEKYQAKGNYVTSVAGKTGEVTLAKTDVGLDQVDNTSDLNKPISTAVQGALDSKADSTAIADMLTKTEASSTYAKKSEIPSTDTFLSKTEASDTYATKTSLNSYLTTSAAASTYQPKGDYLTAVPSEYITESELNTSLTDINSFVTFNQSVKNLTSLANIKPTSRICKYTGTSSSASLSMAAFDGLTVGDEILIIGAKVSTSMTITIPTTNAYVSLSGDTLEVGSGESFEISIVKIATSNPKYVITTKKSI